MSEIETERNLYKGKYRALLKLVSRTRNKLVHVTDHIEDEGDRAYFGSTNDADDLKALYREMMSWIWDATDETNRMKADPYATIRDLRARITALEAENERLRKALETTPPATHVAVPSVDDIAEVLFSQRGTPYRWERAIDADPLSDEGTLVSICRDDARAVLALFAALETKP